MTDRITKFLDSLDAKTRQRLGVRMTELRNNPLQARGVKKLKGWPYDAYRLRVGDIRIIFTLRNKEVEIVDIDYRGNIY